MSKYTEWKNKYRPTSRVLDVAPTDIDYHYVWTLCADETDYILTGFHWVNRMGYIICENPHDLNNDIISLEPDEWYSPIDSDEE